MILNADNFFGKNQKWQKEINLLREIILECLETETLKWKVPVYMYNKANIVIITVLKNYCALGFFKGVLLQDKAQLLVSPGENSQSVKMFKFTDLQQIITVKEQIKAYIFEAIEVEKAGLKVELTQSQNIQLLPELETFFKNDINLQKAFEKLSPGRQRAYNMYFGAPKSQKSKIDRIEKYIPRIISGKGINDCICGLSKKMPGCDGSHKYA